MKKIVLSLAGVLAATAFAPEASAIPAFARQTGMACTACHAQHFPVLNAFGRAFKAGGYTMMGAQGKVEGDHLSIPNQLNASMVLKLRYQKDSSAGAAVSASGGTVANVNNPNTLGDGQVQWDEFALFFGGRISENVGFALEGNMMSGGSLLGGFRMPFVYDVGAAKISVVPFTTDAMGPQMGYEQSSAGVFRANRWAEHRRDISAIQYNADRGLDGGAASGFALVAAGDMGYVSFTKWSPSFAMGANGDAPHDLDSNYFRIAATPTVGNWALHVGAGRMSGTSTIQGASPAGAATDGTARVGAIAGTLIDTDQTFADFQAQGEVGGKELGVYATWARAPATTNCNAYNTHATNAGACRIVATKPVGGQAVSDRKAWTIGADYSVIPNVLSIGAAYRNAETGSEIDAADTLAGRGKDNNAVILTAVYDLYQNVALHLNYSKYSGNDLNRTAAKSVTEKVQSNLMTLMLEAAW